MVEPTDITEVYLWREGGWLVRRDETDLFVAQGWWFPKLRCQLWGWRHGYGWLRVKKNG